MWLKILGITKSLLTYFALNRKNENYSLLFKRRKCDSDIPSILRISDDMDTFLIHLLEENSSHEFEVLGLQLCSFYGTLQDFTKSFAEQLKELLFSKFEKIQCFNWVCFSFIPLLSASCPSAFPDCAGSFPSGTFYFSFTFSRIRESIS